MILKDLYCSVTMLRELGLNERFCTEDNPIIKVLQFWICIQNGTFWFALMTLTFCVLKTHLVSRGHSSRAVHQAIKKVESMPRLSVLSEKPTTRDCANKKIPLVVTYHPSLPPIRQITSANHHILHTSDRLQRAIPEESMIAFKRPPSLRNLLVRAQVPPTIGSIHPIQHGMFRCASRCVTCQEHILE